jgi:hypothetical protein
MIKLYVDTRMKYFLIWDYEPFCYLEIKNQAGPMSSNSFAPHKPIHMHTGLGNLIYQIYFCILIHTHSRVLLIKDNTWFEQNYISTFPA